MQPAFNRAVTCKPHFNKGVCVSKRGKQEQEVKNKGQRDFQSKTGNTKMTDCERQFFVMSQRAMILVFFLPFQP